MKRWSNQEINYITNVYLETGSLHEASIKAAKKSDRTQAAIYTKLLDLKKKDLLPNKPVYVESYKDIFKRWWHKIWTKKK